MDRLPLAVKYTTEEIKALRENTVDAVLIGETMMRSPDKAKMLRFLKGEEHHEES